MNATKLIASHLDESNLKIKIHEDINATCGFSGRKIKRGVLLKDLIKKTFTDNAYVRFGGLYASVDVAMCIEAVYNNGKRLNALRNYSFIATEKEFKVLSRQDVLGIILNAPKEPFVLCVTYSNKKHIAFKSTVNYSNEVFDVFTDLGKVSIDVEEVKKFYPVIKKWYCIVEGKEGGSTEPTYFTKKDVLNGCSDFRKVEKYGVTTYFKENNFLNQYRGTALFKLLVHVLNKTTKND